MDKQPSSREEILGFLADHRDRLQALGVRRLGLFGSFSRGEASPASDLDFLVEFKASSFDAYMDLKFFLEESLGIPVDLVLQDTLKPRLRPRILAETVYAQGL